MSRSIHAVAVLGLILVAGPLLAQNQPAAAMSLALTDAVLPADLDRVLRDYERAWPAGDAKSIALQFTEDGVLLQNYRPPIRSRLAIHATTPLLRSAA